MDEGDAGKKGESGYKKSPSFRKLRICIPSTLQYECKIA